MIPVNLKDLFGDRYRVGLDDSTQHEPGARKDPWHYVIPCRNGSISPFSDELLAFHCTARGIRTRLHRHHPEIDVRNWSDDGEAIFLFRPDQFDLMTKYAKPRRKRRLSPEHRQKLVKAGSLALKSYRKSNSNRDQMASDSTNGTPAHIRSQAGAF